MSSIELTGAITAMANAINCKFAPDEVALIAVILVQFGDTLATILALDIITSEYKNHK